MLCALKIVRAQILYHARNGESSAQNLKSIFFKGEGTYKKVLLHMRRSCEGGFSKRANLTGKISSARRKQTFLSGEQFAIFLHEKVYEGTK